MDSGQITNKCKISDFKVTNLTKAELDSIGTKIGEAFAAENGGMADIIDRESYVAYMKICAEIYYKSGNLFTVDGTGYIAFFPKKKQPKLRYHFLMAGMMFKRLGFSKVNFIMKALKDWNGYHKFYKDQDYLVLEMIAIPIEYQGQGRMKPLINLAFEAAEQMQIPCVLDTETELKKDKYIKCGMKLVKQSTIPSGVTVYVLEK